MQVIGENVKGSKNPSVKAISPPIPMEQVAVGGAGSGTAVHTGDIALPLARLAVPVACLNHVCFPEALSGPGPL